MPERGLSDREVLEIFIESADELLASDFLDQAKADGISTRLNWSRGSGFLNERAGRRFPPRFRLHLPDHGRLRLQAWKSTPPSVPSNRPLGSLDTSPANTDSSTRSWRAEKGEQDRTFSRLPLHRSVAGSLQTTALCPATQLASL